MASLLAHQAVTHPNTVVGTAIAATQATDVYVELYHGFNEATANTNAAAFLLQTSMTESGTDDWATASTSTVATGTPADEHQ